MQDISQWPLVDPLPSYGRGREHLGGRYRSLINGNNLTDVVITGMDFFSLLIFCLVLLEASNKKLSSSYSNCKFICTIWFYFLFCFLTETGENGTIDGQGHIWWESYLSHSLNYSRPHILEIVSSTDILISNLTLLNPPAFSIHPVYSRYGDNWQTHIWFFFSSCFVQELSSLVW